MRYAVANTSYGYFLQIKPDFYISPKCVFIKQKKKAKEDFLLPFYFLPFNRDVKFQVSIHRRNRRRLPLLPRNRRRLLLHRRLTHLLHLELTFLHVCCQNQIPQE
jgi:hypothetical protein